MKTRSALQYGPFAVPIGPDPTMNGYTREMVMPYWKRDIPSPGGGPATGLYRGGYTPQDQAYMAQEGMNPNAGLRAGVNWMAGQNAAIAQRNASGGLQPYRPMNVGPSGLRSYGGAYGGPGVMDTASNRLTDQQVYRNAASPSYRPMGAAGLVGNPGGRFYGGAQPGMVGYGSAGIGPGVQGTGSAGMRPGFLAPPSEPTAGMMDPDQMAAWAAKYGYAYNPATGQMGSPAVNSMSPRESALAGILGRGPSQPLLSPGDAATARANGAPGPFDIAMARREGRDIPGLPGYGPTPAAPGGGLLSDIGGGTPAGPYAAGPGAAPGESPVTLPYKAGSATSDDLLMLSDYGIAPDGRTFSTRSDGVRVYHDRSADVPVPASGGYPGAATGGSYAPGPAGLLGGGGAPRMTPRQMREERKQNAYMDSMYPGMRQQLQQQGQYQQGLLGVQGQQIAASERMAGAEQTGLNTRATAANATQTAIAKLNAEQGTIQRQHELAIRSGDRAEAARLAKLGFKNQQKLAALNNTSQEKVAGLGILRSGIDPQTGLPIQVPLRGQEAMAATQQTEQMDWGGMSPEEVANATANLPPEAQKRIAALARRQQAERLGRGMVGSAMEGTYGLTNPMLNWFLQQQRGY